jgi:hypothetical protein
MQHSPKHRRYEHDLLLTCARVNLNREMRGRLQQLTALDIDWGFFAHDSMLHGVGPLAYHHLTSAGFMNPADPRLMRLRESFFLNGGNGLVLAHELIEVLRRFENAGIVALPFKGPVLGETLYGNIGFRPFTDLDVIVRTGDVIAARNILIEYGYVPQIALTAAQQSAILESKSGYFFRLDRQHRAGPIAFELHWRIPAPFALQEGFWKRIRSVRFAGEYVWHFAPEDLLLVLCAHGFKHAWNRLKWICDVGQMIEVHSSFDWAVALERASGMGGRRALLLGCALAASTLETPMPPDVTSMIRADSAVTKLAHTLERRLFDRPLPRAGVLNNFRIRERLPDKIHYGLRLVGHVAIPEAVERASWPDGPGTVLRYMTHPFRLAGRVAKKYRS